MSEPSVTVVIPAYNAEKWIKEVVWSVRMQDYPNLEMVVVDDASTDNTYRDIPRDDQTVSVISLQENVGACRATDIAYRNIKSDYIMFLAADDCLTDNRTVSHMIYHTRRWNLDWTYAQGFSTGFDSLCPDQYVRTHWFLFPLLDNFILKFPRICYLLLGLRNPVNCSGLIIRSDSYHTANLTWDPFKTRSVCDAYLLAQIFENGNLRGGVVTDQSIFRREHLQQISNTAMHVMHEIKFVEYLYDFHKWMPFWMWLVIPFLRGYKLNILVKQCETIMKDLRGVTNV